MEEDDGVDMAVVVMARSVLVVALVQRDYKIVLCPSRIRNITKQER